MEIITETWKKNSIKIRNYDIGKVKDFKYLGTLISDENNKKPEIDNRATAWLCSILQTQTLFTKGITRKEKIGIYISGHSNSSNILWDRNYEYNK